jgi:Transglycosylase-like domain
MSRAIAILAVLGGAALTAVIVLSATGLAEGDPELPEGEMGEAIVPVSKAHRPMVVSLRESRRLLGVRRAQLESIADCESHGDPRARSSDGLYRGKYQFHRGTWAGIGGDGDPARAPELEQDIRAAMLFRESGPGHWPNCG